MSAVDAALWLPRRLARWTSDHPFRTAGAVAAVLATLVTLVGSGVVGGSENALSGGTTPVLAVDAVLAFAVAHPVYPLTAVLGIGLVLLRR